MRGRRRPAYSRICHARRAPVSASNSFSPLFVFAQESLVPVLVPAVLAVNADARGGVVKFPDTFFFPRLPSRNGSFMSAAELTTRRIEEEEAEEGENDAWPL